MKESDFTMILPTTIGDLQITTTTGTYDDFDQYEVDVNAQYIKLVSLGRFNSAGTSRTSAWTNITEIEFFGSQVLSVGESDFQNNVSVYPNPTNGNLNIKTENGLTIESYKLYSLDGRLVMNAKLGTIDSTFNIDLSKLISGTYILNLSSADGRNVSKRIIISE